MEVILLENIGNLGMLGDKVDVKPGYGRNFLIPQGKAVPATQDNVAKFEARRAELEATAAETLAAAQARGEALVARRSVRPCGGLETPASLSTNGQDAFIPQLPLCGIPDGLGVHGGASPLGWTGAPIRRTRAYEQY